MHRIIFVHIIWSLWFPLIKYMGWSDWNEIHRTIMHMIWSLTMPKNWIIWVNVIRHMDRSIGVTKPIGSSSCILKLIDIHTMTLVHMIWNVVQLDIWNTIGFWTNRMMDLYIWYTRGQSFLTNERNDLYITSIHWCSMTRSTSRNLFLMVHSCSSNAPNDKRELYKAKHNDKSIPSIKYNDKKYTHTKGSIQRHLI